MHNAQPAGFNNATQQSLSDSPEPHAITPITE
jgi:hypothetical protein